MTCFGLMTAPTMADSIFLLSGNNELRFGCQETACPECTLVCAECKKPLCKNHASACGEPRCPLWTCQDCRIECTNCGDRVCHKHSKANVYGNLKCNMCYNGGNHSCNNCDTCQDTYYSGAGCSVCRFCDNRD
jgi:hypothetical protein